MAVFRIGWYWMAVLRTGWYWMAVRLVGRSYRTIKHCWAVGWSDFEKVKATHSILCQIVVGPQFPNFMSLCCLFPLSENLDFYPKTRQTKLYLYFLRFHLKQNMLVGLLPFRYGWSVFRHFYSHADSWFP